MDITSEQRLAEVIPQLADLIRQLADQLAKENITIRVTQGLRTFEQQEALYNQGRLEPGHMVTDARAGESWHNYGCAVDVAPFDDGIPDWNVEHPAWARLVRIGVSLGLRSGISWKDEPHFEYTGTFPPNPPQSVKDIFATGGVEAVWNAILGSFPS